MSKDFRRAGLEKKWRDIIKGLHGSSLSVEAYARAHHISRASLYKWSKRLAETLSNRPLSFVELAPMVPTAEEEYVCVEVIVAKGGCVKVAVAWPKVIEFVKALL